MWQLRFAGLAAVAGLTLASAGAGAQRGGMRGIGRGMMGMQHDSATMAQMSVIHEMVMNHDKITRTVTNLPDGIRTVTESDDPRLTQLIKDHIVTMNERVSAGSDPGLPVESPALHKIFADKGRIRTVTEMTAKGIVIVQTSSDPATVAALQQHAAEVSDLARDGMSAMREAMMKNGMTGMMGRGMMGRGMMGGMMGRGMMGGMMGRGMMMGTATPTRAGRPNAKADSAFAAMQARGAKVMGVDQYTSTHQFDALPDGGRIELQRDVNDTAGVAQIRAHLQQVAKAFKSGDFSTPASVHMQEVPGAAVMAAKRGAISYTYRELPGGGEVRIVTKDQVALKAIQEFMAFQRRDHHAGGIDPGKMPR